MGAIDKQRTLWSDRYKSTGHLWGEGPSVTAVLLRAALDRLNAGSDRLRQVITIGAGTGRDEVHLSSNGANVLAFELASSGVKLGKALAKKNGVDDRIEWKIQDFSTSTSRKEHDALLSHRTLHLLNDDQVVKFKRKASSWVKSGGVLAVSARNYEDFNPEQMRWVSQDEGVAEYKDPSRDGHIIHFWNEARFEKTFGEDFDIKGFSREREIESIDNADTHSSITVMVATRKLKQSFIRATDMSVPHNVRDAVTALAAEGVTHAMRGFMPFTALPQQGITYSRR